MKNRYFIVAFLLLALFGCSSSMYVGGYSDELYFDGSVRERSTYQQKEGQDDRKIVSTDTYTTYNDDKVLLMMSTMKEIIRGMHIFRFLLQRPDFMPA